MKTEILKERIMGFFNRKGNRIENRDFKGKNYGWKQRFFNRKGNRIENRDFKGKNYGFFFLKERIIRKGNRIENRDFKGKNYGFF